MGFEPNGGLSMRTFGVTVSESPHRTPLLIVGEMDLDTCPDVTRVTDALQLRGRTLTLDLAGVYFMDSMCLNMLLRLRQRADIEDGTLELCGLQDQPRRLLDLTGAAGLFSIFERCSPEPVHVTRV